MKRDRRGIDFSSDRELKVINHVLLTHSHQVSHAFRRLMCTKKKKKKESMKNVEYCSYTMKSRIKSYLTLLTIPFLTQASYFLTKAVLKHPQIWVISLSLLS